MGDTEPPPPDPDPIPDLVVASRNPAKVATVARLAAGLARVRPLPDDLAAAGDEDAASVEANAAAKARRASAAQPGSVVVATDGGLLVPALGSAWDPLRTRRFAGAHATDRERADALLALAAGLAGDERRIGWREALAVARDGLPIATWTAEDAPGLLANDYDPRLLSAGGGFWVSALWRCPECDGRRLADLSPAERAARTDHWARLGVELRRLLATLRERAPTDRR
jgi:inosine/xanthosine triphosphate pyrophosphatase family protein